MDRVAHLHYKVIGKGNDKTLRIGWCVFSRKRISRNLTDLRRPGIYKTSSVAMPHRRRLSKIKLFSDNWPNYKKVRLASYLTVSLWRSGSSRTGYHRPDNIKGSYHMELTGTGWQDSVYKPGCMWLDIRVSNTTAEVYEGTFDFGPVLEGLMLISHDKSVIEITSRLMDAVDREIFGDEVHEWRVRDAVMSGMLFAMNRKPFWDEHETRFKAHEMQNYQKHHHLTEPCPRQYCLLLRGRHPVPEWSGDYLNKYTGESSGTMTFETRIFASSTLGKTFETHSKVHCLCHSWVTTLLPQDIKSMSTRATQEVRRRKMQAEAGMNASLRSCGTTLRRSRVGEVGAWLT